MIDEGTVKKVVAEVLRNMDLQERLRPGAISVGVSGRHLHISQEHLEVLFGRGYALQTLKDLSQPGQFAAKETVTVAGQKGILEKVRILGPVRKATQIEISVTDSFRLGVPAVLRDSGDTAGTPGCVIIGPKGSVILQEGVIVAARHLHLHTSDAERLGLKDLDRISIKTPGPKSVLFNNVLVRVNKAFAVDFHLDTDEANAAMLKNGDIVEIVA